MAAVAETAATVTGIAAVMATAVATVATVTAAATDFRQRISKNEDYAEHFRKRIHAHHFW